MIVKVWLESTGFKTAVVVSSVLMDRLAAAMAFALRGKLAGEEEVVYCGSPEKVIVRLSEKPPLLTAVRANVVC
jgi:hypothetical protein